MCEAKLAFGPPERNPVRRERVFSFSVFAFFRIKKYRWERSDCQSFLLPCSDIGKRIKQIVNIGEFLLKYSRSDNPFSNSIYPIYITDSVFSIVSSCDNFDHLPHSGATYYFFIYPSVLLILFGGFFAYFAWFNHHSSPIFFLVLLQLAVELAVTFITKEDIVY